MAKAIPSTDNILGSFSPVFPCTDFSHNLFRDWDHCLRFELGGDDVSDSLCLRRFIQAFERADAVASWLFRDTEELWLLSSDYGDEKARKKRLKPYKKTPLRPSDFQYLGKVFQEDLDDFTGDIYRHWDATILKERWQLREVLWLTLGAEVGVRPTVSADIYVVDFARGLVLHPYDDSGMDVSATRKETLVPLYQEYHDWLQTFRIDEMRAAFEG